MHFHHALDQVKIDSDKNLKKGKNLDNIVDIHIANDRLSALDPYFLKKLLDGRLIRTGPLLRKHEKRLAS